MGEQQCTTAEAVRRLRAGGVLLLATDTLPGLHCRADMSEAIARLVALKVRSAAKPLLILAGSLQQAELVAGDLTAAQRAACGRCWPGPFSLIVPAGPDVSGAVTGGRSTVAIRVPGATALRELILAVGAPLVSTSANVAGQRPAADLAAAAAVFGAELDGQWGENCPAGTGTEPSALVDLTVTPFTVLRPGPIAFPAA